MGWDGSQDLDELNQGDTAGKGGWRMEVSRHG